MTTNVKGTLLKAMMQTCASPRHSVVRVGICNDDHRFIAAGASPLATNAAETIFGIGSITKVITAILLCLLVGQGKVDSRAPLRRMADDLARVPDWITPERLVTLTSGLPNFFMPIWKAMRRSRPDGPYARFSRSDLMALVARQCARVAATPRLFEP